jgi:hypothetical protein
VLEEIPSTRRKIYITTSYAQGIYMDFSGTEIWPVLECSGYRPESWCGHTTTTTTTTTTTNNNNNNEGKTCMP